MERPVAAAHAEHQHICFGFVVQGFMCLVSGNKVLSHSQLRSNVSLVKLQRDQNQIKHC